MFKHPILVVLIATGASAAHAADSPATAAANIMALPPNACAKNPAEVEKLFRTWREAMRQERAEQIARNIGTMLRQPTVAPFVPKGGTCVKNKDWHWAEKAPGEDFFVAQCLMQAKGGSLFLMKFELDVGYGNCITNDTIKAEVNSNMCKTFPGYPQEFFQKKVQVPTCTIGNIPPPGVPPTFRSNPRAEVLDVALFNKLLNAGKDIEEMAEIKEGRVVPKKDAPGAGGGDEPPPINVNNSKEVK